MACPHGGAINPHHRQGRVCPQCRTESPAGVVIPVRRAHDRISYPAHPPAGHWRALRSTVAPSRPCGPYRLAGPRRPAPPRSHGPVLREELATRFRPTGAGGQVPTPPSPMQPCRSQPVRSRSSRRGGRGCRSDTGVTPGPVSKSPRQMTPDPSHPQGRRDPWPRSRPAGPVALGRPGDLPGRPGLSVPGRHRRHAHPAVLADRSRPADPSRSN